MLYSKGMIELVFEVRRRIEPDWKSRIKLTSPSLLDDLARYHPQCDDPIVRALIAELLSLARDQGEQVRDYSITPQRSRPSSESESGRVPRYYRGVRVG